MAGRVGELNLVSFASGLHCAGLHGALVELGYHVRNIEGDNCPPGDTIRLDLPTVFYVGERSYPRDKVSRLLHRARRVPKVGVFRREAPLWDARILQECADFLAWPCEKGELEIRLRRAGMNTAARNARSGNDEDLIAEFGRMNLIGRSPSFVELLCLVKKFATSDAPVMIQGETGTGKELTARAIHYLGERRYHPFIPVNCGAIPDHLLDNELFGHERGAFTDAKSSQKGLVVEAEGGTLFLDELDALSPKAQVALLRFLQDHEYKPLGASRARKANVRVLGATNADLHSLVERGEYRQDLLFRLNILLVAVPPLRGRCEDIHLLAGHFLAQYRDRYRQPEKHLSPRAIEWMESYRWPGNVRELESVVHRAFLLADGLSIELADLLRGIETPLPDTELERNHEFELDFNRAKARNIERFEKSYLTWLLAQTGGNVTHAARRAGKERRALGKLLKKHGIR